MLKVSQVQARSILYKSKVFDYCLNPYTGCSHGCRYCYASLFIPRYSRHTEPWGEFVDVKTNAPELLSKQLPRSKVGTIWIASVCDAYQPLEVRYELTRKCLKEISRHQFPVFIQTKSDLVLRDLDLILELKKVEIGFSIATDNDRIGQLFEPGAPPVSRRLKALERLKKENLHTFVFIGPILPQNPEKLVALIDGLAERVFIDRLNYVQQFLKFYRRYGFEDWTEEHRFREMKEILLRELSSRKIMAEVIF